MQKGCSQIYCRAVSRQTTQVLCCHPLFLPCLQVFTLQEALQSSRTIPIIRHTRSATCPASFLFLALFKERKGPVLPSGSALPALNFTLLCRTSVSPVLCQMV